MNTKQSTEYFEAGQHFADAIAEIFAKRIRSELEDMVKNYSLLNDLRNSSMTEASQAKDEHKLLLNVKEAAKALGISTRALHNRTAPRGPIPAVHIGALVRYTLEDLQAYIIEIKCHG